MEELIEKGIEVKERELARLQEYFRIDIKNISSPNYEDIAINALLEMKKLKTEIDILKLYLQFQQQSNY